MKKQQDDTQRQRAESLLVAAYRSGITDPKELANFMGQVQHESQNFTRLEENLNYSARRLPEVWPRHFYLPPDAADGRLDASQAEVEAAARAAHAHEFIQRLPQGCKHLQTSGEMGIAAQQVALDGCQETLVRIHVF